MFPRRIRRHRSARPCSNLVDVCPPSLAENCPKISWRAIMGGVAMETRMTPTKTISRRSFLTKTATTAAAITIVPRHVLGRGFVPPSDMLNIAGIGVGGMGRANLINLSEPKYRRALRRRLGLRQQIVRSPRHRNSRTCKSASTIRRLQRRNNRPRNRANRRLSRSTASKQKSASTA